MYIYIYFKIKNPLESIGASFSKISLIEPEIFKVKEWFQVKVPIPFSFRSFLIGVYDFNKCFSMCIMSLCFTVSSLNKPITI